MCLIRWIKSTIHKGFVDVSVIRRRKVEYEKSINCYVCAAIILPEQSLASEKAGLAVSKKGLTLKELLQQTSHHNAKVRRGTICFSSIKCINI